MAITAIVGRPGHGKSYSAAEIAILPALREGRAIYTNIPLKLDAIYRDFPNAQVTHLDLSQESSNDSEFWAFSPGALIVLDELWRVWPSGLKANAIPEAQKSFIKEHRHRTDNNGRWQDIVLVTQSLSDIAATVRDMTETTVICMQMSDLGANDWFVREYYNGAIKGVDSGPKDRLINNERIKYSPEIYQYYQSNTKGTNPTAGPQGAKVIKQSFFTSWKFRAGCALLVFFIISTIWGGISSKKGIEKLGSQSKIENPSASTTVETKPLNQPVQTVQTQKIPEPVESRRWRVSGFVTTPKKHNQVVISDGKYHRHIDASRCDREGPDYVCIIRGEIIARWTGQTEKNVYPVEIKTD